MQLLIHNTGPYYHVPHGRSNKKPTPAAKCCLTRGLIPDHKQQLVAEGCHTHHHVKLSNRTTNTCRSVNTAVTCVFLWRPFHQRTDSGANIWQVMIRLLTNSEMLQWEHCFLRTQHSSTIQTGCLVSVKAHGATHILFVSITQLIDRRAQPQQPSLSRTSVSACVYHVDLKTSWADVRWAEARPRCRLLVSSHLISRIVCRLTRAAKYNQIHVAAHQLRWRHRHDAEQRVQFITRTEQHSLETISSDIDKAAAADTVNDWSATRANHVHSKARHALVHLLWLRVQSHSYYNTGSHRLVRPTST